MNNKKNLFASLFLLFSILFGSYHLIFGIDWIQYNERVVGENHPTYTDVVNRPMKQIYGLFTSQHTTAGVHDLASISTNLYNLDGAGTWKVFYTDGYGILTELALGASGEFLQSQGAAAAPTWAAGGGGTGDVESVGDCLSGACYDGTSDGGTYARIYDGDSHYLELNPGNLTANRTLTTRDAAGTLLVSGDTLTGDVSATFDTDGSTAATVTDLTISSEAQGDILYFDGSNWVRLAAGTSGHFLKTQGAAANPIWAAATASGFDYVKVSDVKTSGTGGGSATSGSYQTRDINTEDSDTSGIASIATNQITLAAGTYIAKISCPAYKTNNHKAQLYNITGSAVLLLGTSEFAGDAASYPSNRSVISGKFTLGVQSALEIQHRVAVSSATIGWGVPASFGDSEVYTIAEFWRIN